MYQLKQKKLKTKNTINISGELTIYSVKSIFDEFKQHTLQDNNLSLDLAKVTEIDTAGAQLLLMLKQSSESNRKRFEINQQSESVTEFLQLFNLTTLSSGDNHE